MRSYSFLAFILVRMLTGFFLFGGRWLTYGALVKLWALYYGSLLLAAIGGLWQGVFNEAAGFSVLVLASWARCGFVDVGWAFFGDKLTCTIVFTVVVVSAFVQLFALQYRRDDPHVVRFIAYINLFTRFRLLLVISANLRCFFIGWEGVGVCSFLLISFWFTRAQAVKAALKARVRNKVGDVALFVVLVIFAVKFGTFDFLAINFLASLGGAGVAYLFCFLFLAVVRKSVQVGLHAWLTDAMEGPTPVSALLHAATIVTAGVFLFFRLSGFVRSVWFSSFLRRFFALITVLLSGVLAGVEEDLKKIVALSTANHLALMVRLCGLGFYGAAFFHIVNHAFSKALLFVCAGVIIHIWGDEQNVSRFVGVKALAPFLFFSAAVPILSLLGLVFRSPAYSKEVIFNVGVVQVGIHGSVFSGLLIMFTLFCSSVYSVRLWRVFGVGGGQVPLVGRWVFKGVLTARPIYFFLALAGLLGCGLFSAPFFYYFLGYGGVACGDFFAHGLERTVFEMLPRWVKFLPVGWLIFGIVGVSGFVGISAVRDGWYSNFLNNKVVFGFFKFARLTLETVDKGLMAWVVRFFVRFFDRVIWRVARFYTGGLYNMVRILVCAMCFFFVVVEFGAESCLTAFANPVFTWNNSGIRRSAVCKDDNLIKDWEREEGRRIAEFGWRLGSLLTGLSPRVRKFNRCVDKFSSFRQTETVNGSLENFFFFHHLFFKFTTPLFAPDKEVFWWSSPFDPLDKRGRAQLKFDAAAGYARRVRLAADYFIWTHDEEYARNKTLAEHFGPGSKPRAVPPILWWNLPVGLPPEIDRYKGMRNDVLAYFLRLRNYLPWKRPEECIEERRYDFWTPYAWSEPERVLKAVEWLVEFEADPWKVVQYRQGGLLTDVDFSITEKKLSQCVEQLDSWLCTIKKSKRKGGSLFRKSLINLAFAMDTHTAEVGRLVTGLNDLLRKGRFILQYLGKDFCGHKYERQEGTIIGGDVELCFQGLVRTLDKWLFKLIDVSVIDVQDLEIIRKAFNEEVVYWRRGLIRALEDRGGTTSTFLTADEEISENQFLGILAIALLFTSFLCDYLVPLQVVLKKLCGRMKAVVAEYGGRWARSEQLLGAGLVDLDEDGKVRYLSKSDQFAVEKRVQSAKKYKESFENREGGQLTYTSELDLWLEQQQLDFVDEAEEIILFDENGGPEFLVDEEFKAGLLKRGGQELFDYAVATRRILSLCGYRRRAQKKKLKEEERKRKEQKRLPFFYLQRLEQLKRKRGWGFLRWEKALGGVKHVFIEEKSAVRKAAKLVWPLCRLFYEACEHLHYSSVAALKYDEVYQTELMHEYITADRERILNENWKTIWWRGALLEHVNANDGALFDELGRPYQEYCQQVEKFLVPQSNEYEGHSSGYLPFRVKSIFWSRQLPLKIKRHWDLYDHVRWTGDFRLGVDFIRLLRKIRKKRWAEAKQELARQVVKSKKTDGSGSNSSQ